MRTQAATPMDGDVILVHFRQRRGHGHGKYLDNLAYHLMRMVLEGEEFGSFESLIKFCRIPGNLGRWLPTKADRLILSDRLARGLREIALDSACNLCVAQEETLLDAMTARSARRA